MGVGSTECEGGEPCTKFMVGLTSPQPCGPQGQPVGARGEVWGWGASHPTAAARCTHCSRRTGQRCRQAGRSGGLASSEASSTSGGQLAGANVGLKLEGRGQVEFNTRIQLYFKPNLDMIVASMACQISRRDI